MEYFDFEQAAQDDDVASDCPVIDDSDAAARDDAVLFDKDLAAADILPPQPNSAKERDTTPLHLDNGVYPVARAKEPCDLCRARGLDCFMARRGVMQNNGCTCCISLYRECSFTHAKPNRKYMDTLHVVSEDTYVPTGSVTGKKALRSFDGGATGTVFEELDPRVRKSGARFSREAVRILKSWLSNHITHPYPTDEEKNELKQKTGLKRSQICNWLANARRRGKVRPTPRDSSPPPGASRALNIPGKRLDPGIDISHLTPFERWKYSPPEHEPAAATDIIRAMESTPYPPGENASHPGHVRSYSRKTGSSNDGSSSFSNVMHPPSVSSYSLSLDTTKSSISDMSFASAFSHRSSRASFNSMDAKERRRRRHKSAVGQNTFQKARANNSRIFQCTFCSDSFATKYDWQRHEKSLHLALDKWICAPQGGVLSLNGVLVCAFCRSPNPDERHLETHNCNACQEKSIQERTFYRKDHLSQHLRLMHDIKIFPWMESWRSVTTEIKSRCGFCSSTFTTWKDRIEHLTAHFKSGADMSQWKGDWGFDPFVQRLVENAMPPYLIGQEHKLLDPYVAQGPANITNGDSSAASPNIPVPRDANCFQRLTVELSAYIGRHVGSGTIPTDSEIQDEARRIIYGSDDPWNQTCADNPVWLSVLKRDNGLCDLPEVEDIRLDDLGMQPPYAAPGLTQPPKHNFPMLQPPFSSSGFNSSGFQSPTFNSNGFNSGAPSVHGSFMDSIADSMGVSSAGATGCWPCLTTSNTLSSSAPVSAGLDPLSQMGFEAQFLHHLDDGFGDVSLNIDDMHIDGLDFGGDPGTVSRNSICGPPPSFNMAASVPIDIPSSSVPVTGVEFTSTSFDPRARNVFDDHFDNME
ncbi:hypothetical protein FQN50_003236 [Emmonsiellopsis sp. PD_5]|nr:hypothetical protein FQN50_003236 [Emmonsiellopsis sp. PD_5]